MPGIKQIDDSYFSDFEKSKETWINKREDTANAETYEVANLNDSTDASYENKKDELFKLYDKYKNGKLSKQERQTVAEQIDKLKTEIEPNLKNDLATYKDEIQKLETNSSNPMTSSIIESNQQEYNRLNELLTAKISSSVFAPRNMQDVSNKLDIDSLPLTFDASHLEQINQLKKETGARFGLDIAHYQYPIDYNKVYQSGIDYVIIQWGGRNSNGDRYIDGGLSEAEIRQNVMAAIDAGLDVGLYTWAQPVNEAEAATEAQWTLDFINSLPEEYRNKLTMPIAYDYEAFSGRSADVSVEQHTSNINAFNKVMAENGYETMTYSGRASGFGAHINGDEILSDTNYNWVAEYGANNKYSGEYSMWQYSSDASVDGIGNRADINVYYE